MLNTAHCEKMRDVLIKSIQSRFESMMEVIDRNRDLFLAAVTHPLFKMMWIPEDELELVKHEFR